MMHIICNNYLYNLVVDKDDEHDNYYGNEGPLLLYNLILR